jgi:NAD(P)-dependent dehydrogenase (short-subunit alcohol dehydrogenase family)
VNVNDLVDATLEATVVPSFTKLGYLARRRVDEWDTTTGDLAERVIVVTGATSGLGKCAAEQLAGLGATIVVVGRSENRNAATADDIAETTGSTTVTHAACDLGDLDQVRDLAERVLADHDRLDVLIHNAGALSAERQLSPDGVEMTVASQVVGPFLLTHLLLDRLSASGPARVLTMSSGGMYTAALTVSGLQMSPDDYQGAKQYALAKRAQVTLNEMWAERCGDRGIRFHAMHPGWADTPGVEAALPGFRKVMGPLLRSPEQGADTLVWLAADDGEPLTTNGRFWLDRRARSLHKLPTTKRSDTPERRDRLWNWVADAAGVSES